MPKRLRWYLEREPRAVSAVLHILLRVIEAYLRRSSGGNSQARSGAVSFIHRFGASLNRHVHYHCCGIDGVFEPAEDAGDIPQSVRFRPAAELTPEAVAVIAEQVRVRVLRWFARSGLIEPDDVREMLAWENSGFSLDAAVRVGAHDLAGLERLLRYCARPPFALERLELIDEQQVIYRLPRTQRDGTTVLSLTPLELIDSTDDLDWGKARPARLPNLKPTTKTISLRLPIALLDSIRRSVRRGGYGARMARL